ncbi:GH25 family lysozyme [Ruminococcus sp. Marseille-P6503]|uniref:glycoside hydrolase family 25 protein n=1 Tax=Ruminococcus sp. Marseille-P6503 TaxID=2364796 RepID=UPI000F52CA1A|nr:GH25 family lysozyme [Ruminococcus sp. Marseille-P6503]
MLFHRRKNRSDKKSAPFQLDSEAVGLIDEEFSDDGLQRQRRRKRRRFLFKLAVACLAVIALNYFVLVFTGKISVNEPRKRDYPSRGAVISDSLGEIKWGTLANRNMSFVYIQASKGVSYEDKSFKENWRRSSDSELMTGAVHDFDFKKDGKAQAEHFCGLAGENMSGRLYPALDLTMSLWERIFEDDPVEVCRRIADFTEYVSAEYGCEVILICDRSSYDRYISTDFSDRLIWVISTSKEPDFCSEWFIWQYFDKEKSDWYENGDKRYSLLVARKGMTPEELKEKFTVK